MALYNHGLAGQHMHDAGDGLDAVGIQEGAVRGHHFDKGVASQFCYGTYKPAGPMLADTISWGSALVEADLEARGSGREGVCGLMQCTV